MYNTHYYTSIQNFMEKNNKILSKYTHTLCNKKGKKMCSKECNKKIYN